MTPRASRKLWFFFFHNLCSYCNSEQIQSIFPCCFMNWWLFNIWISHLPHSFRHASVKETNTLRKTHKGTHAHQQTGDADSPVISLQITELYAWMLKWLSLRSTLKIGSKIEDRRQLCEAGNYCVCVCVHTHSSIMAFLDVSQVITVNQASFQDL